MCICFPSCEVSAAVFHIVPCFIEPKSLVVPKLFNPEILNDRTLLRSLKARTDTSKVCATSQDTSYYNIQLIIITIIYSL